MNRTKKIMILSIFLLGILCFSVIYSPFQNSNDFFIDKTILNTSSSGNLQFNNKDIEDGDTLTVDQNHNFDATFYNTSNIQDESYTNAYMESIYIDDPSLNYSNEMTLGTNQEIKYGTNGNIENIQYGYNTANGTLNSKDSHSTDYASTGSGFDYNYEEHEEYNKSYYYENFNSEESWMSKSSEIDDNYNHTYTTNPLYLKNQFPNEQKNEDFLNWNLNYDSDYTTSSYSNGDFESTIIENTTYGEPSYWELTNGTLDSSGNLESQDNNYHTFSSEDTTISGTSMIYPNGDLWTDWKSVSANHYEDVDETSGNDGDVVQASGSANGYEGYEFSSFTLPSNTEIYKVDVYVYGRFFGTPPTPTVNLKVGSWQGAETYSLGGTWGENTIHSFDGLSADQSDLNGIEIQFYVEDFSLGPKIQHDYVRCNVYYRSIENELNISTSMELSDLSSIDTITNFDLHYAYYTNVNQDILFEIYNYDSSSYDTIDSSNYDSFSDLTFTINSSHYNSNSFDNITLRLNGSDYNDAFEFYLDRLQLNYTYDKRDGDVYADITKNVSFSFLNRYDSYSNYQDLYNITIDFDYHFTTSNSDYSDFAEYYVNSQEFSLTKDGSSHSFSYSFQFDSSSLDTFSQKFNISNGLLELSNFQYTFFFECLNTSGNRVLQQRFDVDYNISALGIDSYVIENGMFFINNTYDFNANSDHYSYLNTLGTADLLNIIYYIKADGFWYSYSYGVSSSEDLELQFNVSNFMDNRGLSTFQDFNISYVILGNDTEITITELNFYDLRTYIPRKMQFDMSFMLDSIHLLDFNLSFYHKFNITQELNISIYNYETNVWGEWENLTQFIVSDSYHTSSWYNSSLSRISEYIDDDGTIKIRFNAINRTSFFTYSLDYIAIKVYREYSISYSRSFSLLGSWKYRYKLVDTSLNEWYSDYIFINVVLAVNNPNVELISESKYTTKWETVYSEYVTDTIDLYEDDLTSNDWTSNVDGEEFSSLDTENYLLENTSSWHLNLASYDGISYSVQGTYPRGLFFKPDGTKLYEVSAGEAYVYQHSLSSAWDLSTASYDSVSYQCAAGDPSGIFFKPDGTKLYEVDAAGFNVYQHSLSSAWDLNSASYDSVRYPVQGTSPFGLFFKPDGTKLYEVSADEAYVYQHSLSSAWDLNSASYDSVRYPVQDTSPTGLFFKSDGTKMYEIGSDYDYVYQHSLSSAWDLNSASYDSVRYSVQDGVPSEIFFKPDGAKLYEVGFDNRKIYQHSTLGISKFYQNKAKGYSYVQTNTEETLTIQSQSGLGLSLQTNDKIEVQFNTTTTNNVDLNLKGTSLDQSYEIVSQNNKNFDDQRVSLSLTEDITLNQLEIEGIFDDTKNFYLQNIRIYRYNESADETSKIFYVPSGESKEVSITYPKNITFYVYENGVLKQTFSLTTSKELQYLIFERNYPVECYISYYNLDNDYMEFQDFTTYIDYTLDDVVYTDERLSTNVFYADEETTVNISIYDSFDTSIKNTTKSVRTFIDIDVEVYDLTIKNEASKYIDYALQKKDSGVSKTGQIASQELEEYHISSGNYYFNFTNNEDGSYTSTDFSFTNHKLIIINTTYNDVYFSAYLEGEIGFDYSNVKFYINSTRSDFGFNTLSSDYVNLTVKDMFNQSIYQSVVDVSKLSEYDIYLNVYELELQNKAQEKVKYSLEINNRVISGIIASQKVKEYLLGSGNYTLNYTNYEDSSYHKQSISLDSNTLFAINSTYYDIYFALFNYDGLGLDKDLFRFYINGARREFGSITIKQDINVLLVKDYFNQTLFSKSINLDGYTEYNINVEVYNLIINNNYTHSIKLKIERNGIEIEQIIPEQSGISYRFLPGVEYELTTYFTNGTMIESRTIELEENNQIVSFGFYSAEFKPQKLLNFTNNALIIFTIIAGLVVILAGLIIYFDRQLTNEKKKPKKHTYNKTTHIRRLADHL